MYTIQTEIKDSKIEGKGIFTLQKIAKNEIVWKFTPGHDKTLSVDEFNKLDKDSQADIEKFGYLSSVSDL